MADINASLWGLERALKGGSEAVGQESQIAVVKRIEKDGTVIVSYPGSDYEAPLAATTSELNAGDYVPVTVRNGRAYAVQGNQSDPSIGGGAVNVMVNAVGEVAENAVRSAATASAAASQAVASAAVAEQAATDAQDSLKSVVQGATTVEKAVSVMQTALEAVIDYDPTNDTIQEYFWHDAAGAHVLGDTSGYRNDIDSTGMDIVDVSTEKSLAHFGTTARIGKEYEAQASDNESHMELDYHSMQLVDREGDTYFWVSDLRDSDGTARVSDRFVGDGRSASFTLTLLPDDEPTVTLNGAVPTFNYTVSVDRTTSLATIYNTDTSSYFMPSIGVVVVFSYTSQSQEAKAFTFGTRATNSNVGGYSFAEGIDVAAGGMYSHAEGAMSEAGGYASHSEGDSSKASRYASHAEGINTIASGYASHAEGEDTIAANLNSHAEGWQSTAYGEIAHAQNYATIANSSYQTAIGKCNKPDNNNAYALIIGNGSSPSSEDRSDALCVDWNGNVRIAGNVQNMSGTQLYTNTRVKGNAEGSYRTGDVNLTPANLGALPLTAGTDAPITSTLYAKGTHDRDGSTPSSDQGWIGYAMTDKDGERTGLLTTVRRSSSYATYPGSVQTNLYCYGENGSGTEVSNYLFLGIMPNGTRYVQLAESAIWRTALGLDSLFIHRSASQAWSSNIAANGTQNVTVTFTVPSGYTISAVRRVSSGNSYVNIAGFYISGSTVVVALHNPTSSARSSNNGVTVDVQMVKSISVGS